MFCRKCGKEMNDIDMFCSSCGAPVVEQPMSETAMPMKWYKFLIYFSLFAGAITSALGAIFCAVLIIKDIEMHLSNPLLFGLEMAYAACSVVFAVFALYARYALAEYKRKGPFLLYICYGISGLSEVIYAVYSYVAGTGADVSVVISILTTVAMIAANHIYFTKRSHLFVN